MKKIVLMLALIAGGTALHAQEQSGYVTYALPKTSIVIEVTASQEVFHAGPYAQYAQKYLGTEVRRTDETTFKVTEVKAFPATEADQQQRFQVLMDSAVLPQYLQLTSQGLIAGQEGAFTESSGWKFPAEEKGGFSSMPANLTSESNTLYSRAGAVQQSVVVEKSAEKKAQETAEMIFKIRENRYKILVGDTDATYSGEAMKATIDELTKMEKEYLTLFTGYSDYNTQTATFEVVPTTDNKNQIYIAFRLSDSEGLVSADNVEGKPFFLELNVEPIADACPVTADKRARKPDQLLQYRIPAICGLKLTDGMATLLQSRVPVYQLGLRSTYPIFYNKK